MEYDGLSKDEQVRRTSGFSAQGPLCRGVSGWLYTIHYITSRHQNRCWISS